MSFARAVILGVVQGLAEFLPISSSAHLTLVPWLFRWPDPGLSFDVALHLGTVLAVIAYFWRDWLRLLAHGLHGTSTAEGRLFWLLAAASVPGAAAGALLEREVETTLRNPLVIGLLLMGMGCALYLADLYGAKRQRDEAVGFGQSLVIGFAQALAIVPGISRAGATMTAGLALGLTRQGAARFSFLLSVPIVLGAGLYKLRHVLGVPGVVDPPFMAGVLASALVGFLVIGLLLRWLQRSSFVPFVLYRLFLGAVILVVFFLRARG